MSDPADAVPSQPGPESALPTPPAPTAKRRRRLPIWLKIVGALVLLLGLLVLLAPTIASTAPVRSYVLGNVNASLNGRVEVADWSLGWVTGLKLDGVHVKDAGGQEILTIGSLTSELTVLDLLRGEYSLGDTVVDGLDFKLRREADGEFNFAKIAKATNEPAPPPPPATPGAEPPSPTDAPAEPEKSKLPNLSGRFVVSKGKGSFEDVAKRQVVQFPSIDGTVKVPDINQPIENDLTVVAIGGDGKQGTLTVKGTADAVDGNEVRVEQANVDQSIQLTGLGLSAVAAFMPSGSLDRMAGDASATVTLKMTAGQSGVLTADVRAANVVASGPALKGDTFSAREVSLVIPRTTIDMSAGHGATWVSWPIRTGGTDKAEPIALTVRHEGYDDVVALAVNATPQALMNVAANARPGANGEVSLSTTVNLGGLARQLPRVFPERDGRRLSSGRLEQSTLVTLGSDTTSFRQTLDLKELAVSGPGGAVEALQPVHQELRFNSHGGGWEMPALDGIRLALDSGFAKAEFGGKELTELKGTAEGDLAKARRDLGPVVPALADLNIAGTFRVDLTSTGDVASRTAPIDVSLAAALTNFQFNEIAQPHARLEAGAKLVRSEAGIEALDGVSVSARSGRSERELTLDAQLTADVKYIESKRPNPATGQVELVRVAEVPRYAVERLNVDLAAAQRDFAPGGDVRVDSGTLSLTGSGSRTADVTTFDVKGRIKGLNVTRAAPVAASASATLAQVLPAPADVRVLQDYDVTLDAAGSHATAGTRLTRLNVADNRQMVTLRQGKGEIVIPASGAAPPSGELVLGADLKKLLDVSRAFGGTMKSPDAPDLTSGRVDGTLRLAAAPGPENLIGLTGQLDATGLTVRTPEGEPVKDERVTLKPSVRLTRDWNVINVDYVNVDGRLIKGRVFDTIIDGKAGDAPGAAPLAAVRKANALLDFPRLADVHALLLAINPPEPANGKQPGRIRGGSANVRVTLGHQGNAVVVTPEVDVRSLSLGTAAAPRDVGDVTVRSAVRLVGAANPPADATFLQRLSELNVPTLSIKGAGADVKLEQPLVIKDPAGATATASAVLGGRIDLAALCGALEAWQRAEPGTAYPYAGNVSLRQELATAPGGVISLVGSAGVKEFATTGKEATGRFAEPEVTFVNQIKLDPNAKVLTIDRLSFATETTGAARVAATGAIRDYDTARRFDKLVVDLDYDAKTLWDILRPLMAPETGGKSLEEFAMSGKRKQTLEIAGSYPAGDPNAIRHVRAVGGFALDTLDARGLSVAQLDLRFLLEQGVLRLQHATNAAPPTTAPGSENLPPGALCNDSGVLSFHDFTVDLNGEHPRLNTPDNHPLIRGVSINPVVADTLLGRFVNPAFNDATQAKGILNVTVVSCRGLALDTSMQSPNPRESGRAELRWSLDDLFLSQPDVIKLIARLKPNALNENGVAGAVREGRVVIEGGQVLNDMTFVVDKYALKFNGGIGLAENKLANFFVTLPPELFAAIDEKFARHVPREGYRVALRGTTDNWFKGVTDAIVPIVADLGVRAGLGSVLDRALGGDKDRRERDRDARDRPDDVIGRPRDAERPAARESDDPLGDLLDRAIGGDRETDAEKAARRERTRREREAKRDAEAAAATQPTTAPAEAKLTKRERERLRNEQKRKEREERERQKKEQREKR